MRDYQIYLCGGMALFGKENFDECDKWRRQCKELLESYEGGVYKVNVINPNNYFNFIDDPPLYNTQDEVMKFDLHKLRNSNLVIVNFNDPNSKGTMAEIAIAYDRGIPIIGLNIDNYDLHPWQICMCERIFDDIDVMTEYIKKMYL